MKKRILSCLMVLALVLGMFPVLEHPAAAVENFVITPGPHTSGLVLKAGSITRVAQAGTDVTAFAVSNTNGTALKVEGTTDNPSILSIPEGLTLTVTASPGNPGILLEYGHKLIVTGGGTLIANGGSGTNGENGNNGGDGTTGKHGKGGKGGSGGTGAGAGIGLPGQAGGTGGRETGTDGGAGESGSAGSSASYTQKPMGELIVLGDTKIIANGGEPGKGARQSQYAETSSTGGSGANISGTDQSGGGGGGGGGGGSAGYGIGAGGIGGGGGGSGGSGKGGAKGKGGSGQRGHDGYSLTGSGGDYGTGGDGGRGGGQNDSDTLSGNAPGGGGYGVRKSGYSSTSATASYLSSAGNLNVTEFSRSNSSYARGISVNTAAVQGAYLYGEENLVSERYDSALSTSGPEELKRCLVLHLQGNGDVYNHGVYTNSTQLAQYFWMGHTSIPNATTTDTWKLTRRGYRMKGIFDNAVESDPEYMLYDENGIAVGNGNGLWTSAGRWDAANDVELYVHWEPLTVEVSFDVNGGVGGAAAQTWTFDAAIAALPTEQLPTYTGYRFLGYYDSLEGGNRIFDATGSMVHNGGKSDLVADTRLYARWTPITYRIQFFGADGTSLLGTMNGVSYEDLTLPGADGLADGTRVFDGDLRREGCNFLGWSTVAGQSAAMYRPNVRYTVGIAEVQNATVRLFPVWAPMDSYTVTYDANGGLNAPAPGTVREDNTGYRLSDEKPARENYTFLGWADSSTADAAQYQPGDTLGRVASDRVLYAVWKHNPRVVYDANGGYFTVSLPVDYPAPGSDYTLTTIKPVQAGHKFLGWAINGADVAESGIHHVGDGEFSDLIFRARWRAANYRLTLDSAAGVTLTFETPDAVTSGSNYPYQTAFAFTAAGDGTVRVYLNGVLLSPQDDGKYHFTLTESSTLKITLTPVEPSYIVSYSPNGGHDAPFDRASYRAGDAVTLASGDSMTRTGYLFTGWNTQSDGSGDGYAAGDALRMDSADAVLYAQWRPITYTVAYDANGGEGTMASQTLAYDADGTIAANGFTRSGYAFRGWARSSVGLAAYLGGETIRCLSAADGETITLYAVWEALPTYTVNYDANGGTGGPAQSAPVPAGGSCAVSAEAPTRPNFDFLGWSGDKNAADADPALAPGEALTLTGNLTLYAVWRAVPTYAVAYDGNGGGDTVENVPAAGTKLRGVDFVLSAQIPTRSGYDFAGWSDGTSTYRPGGIYSADAPVTLLAQWTRRAFTLTLDDGGAGTIAVTRGGETLSSGSSIFHGDTLTITARPLDGYTTASFRCYINGSPLTGGAAAVSATVTVTGDVSVLLVDLRGGGELRYTVRYDANGGSGAIADQTQISTAPSPLSDGALFQKEHARLLGWATAPNGGVVYALGETPAAPLAGNGGTVTLYAVWQPDAAYTVTYDANGGSGAPADGASYYENDTVALLFSPAPVREGWVFLGWSRARGAAVPDYTERGLGSLTMGAADLTLYAVWQREAYAVTVEDNGIADVTITTRPDGSGRFPGNTTVEFTVAAAGGSVLSALSASVNGTFLQLDANPAEPDLLRGAFPITQDSILSIHAGASYYTVTYDTNGGDSPAAADTVRYITGRTVTLHGGSGFARSGYHLAGWNTQSDGSGTAYALAGTVSGFASDTTLYAVWEPDADPRGYSYTVHYDPNGGTGSAADQTLYQNDPNAQLYAAADVPDFARGGYTLAGWTTAPGGTAVIWALGGTLHTPLALAGQTVTLYAVWQRDPISVTLSDPQGVCAVPSVSVQLGSTYGALPALSKEGFSFLGWYNDRGERVESTTLVTNGAPHTLTARWSSNSSSGGTAAPAEPEKPEELGGYSIGYRTCPRDKSCPAYCFRDLDLKLWYHDGIHFCVENGLMQGLPDDLFAPDGVTTRAQIVTILWRVEGEPRVERTAFPDVAEGAWYAGVVGWAAANEIVLGYDSGLFGPDDPITREQFAAILYRYARYRGYDTRLDGENGVLRYEDAAEVSPWAADALQWACARGVVSGMSESLLLPQGSATRAQAAAMIMRFVISTAEQGKQ